MFLPNDIREDIPHEDTVYSRRQMKTLFLLHGYTGCAENWVPEYLAEKYNFAIVMPNGKILSGSMEFPQAISSVLL